MQQRKKETAALKIQRLYRRRQAARKRLQVRKQLRDNVGITNEDKAILEVYITPDVLEER
jgi:hypothetical protein